MIIRRGISRTVLLTRRYAVKVPSFRGHCTGRFRGRLRGFAVGIIANQDEADWHDFEGWEGQVAPVLHSWIGGLINVYPRCEPLPLDAAGAYFGDEPLPTLDPDPGDHKPDNYGILGGRIVRIDYAMN